MSTFRAAGVEQKIVEVPETKAIVTFGRAEAAVMRGIELEKDLAIHQQGEQRDTAKTALSTEFFKRLWRCQRGQAGRNVCIANSKQCG